jgi:hypothetical protein
MAGVNDLRCFFVRRSQLAQNQAGLPDETGMNCRNACEQRSFAEGIVKLGVAYPSSSAGGLAQAKSRFTRLGQRM